MRKTHTWKDNLNDVIRTVIFPDDELKDLMMLPTADRKNIIRFIEKYFIRNENPDELVTTEDVRICYGDIDGVLIGSNILRKFIFFDIYVHTDHLHDYGKDMLAFRTDMIVEKLKELLTDEKYVCNIDFSYEDDFGMYTKIVGYTRHRIILSYKISF